MQLGFVSAILPDLSLREVLEYAAETGYACVEVMCWPVGQAERRYAGVTHIDVASFTAQKIEEIHDLTCGTGVGISGLGYYPNPLSPSSDEALIATEQITRVIDASAALGIGVMNTFIGRDPSKSVDDNWPRFLAVWTPVVAHAKAAGVKIGIENCPMYFSADEWPSGKNLAISPAVWRRMFEDFPGDTLGLNYDPSHLVWQMMDPIAPILEFADKLVHVHAKDVRIDRAKLNNVGIMAPPNEYHDPKLPGLGEVDWGRFFSTLCDAGYDGPVCVEVEDRAYEGSLESRKAALRQSARFLRNFI